MKSSKKAKSGPPSSKQKFVLIAIVLVVVLGAAFSGRGWIRLHAMPTAVEMVYGNSAERVYRDETAKLQEPFKLLGYTNPEVALNDCFTVLANGFSTQVNCSYNIRAFREIDTSEASRQTLKENAEKLQAYLKENGWEGTYENEGSYTSLVRLMTSITSNIDYQPDATYQKDVGNVTCLFQNNTAFAAPDPPAIATQMTCSRTVNILGQPGWD